MSHTHEFVAICRTHFCEPDRPLRVLQIGDNEAFNQFSDAWEFSRQPGAGFDVALADQCDDPATFETLYDALVPGGLMIALNVAGFRMRPCTFEVSGYMGLPAKAFYGVKSGADRMLVDPFGDTVRKRGKPESHYARGDVLSAAYRG